MKGSAIFLMMLSALVVAAQDAPPLTQVPEGTLLAVELSKTLDARKLKAGEVITARTTQDMLSQGKIVVPRDTRITGHIIESQGRAKGQKGEATSSISIAFDELEMKGKPVPFHASIQAIAKPIKINAATGLPGSASNDETAVGYGGGTINGGDYGRTPGMVPPPPPVSPSSTDNPPASNDAIDVKAQGVIGIKGLALNSGDQGSVISSTTENVKLENGTQLVLKGK